MTTEGLRARKKRETRRRISDIATMLFAQRGFDNVTIAEVAEAADVAKKTVTNYFSRKEDLLLDRHEDRLIELDALIRGRPAHESIAAVLRRHQHELLAAKHPLSGVVDRIQPFLKIMTDSPALMNRAREMNREIEQVLTGALVSEGAEPLEARLVGVQLASAMSAIWDIGVTRSQDWADTDLVRREQVGVIDAAFDLVERGIGDYGTR
ncbi:TetR/AcrR family transcriptional regulator [Amycolatopsis sp. H20-H5]|uniref:TetR/AcrR family transcriptional regulator n=1 Tax=Amycolatopsis sp. H20-H5 TaxID=3046309 RepID=UPI002DBFBB7C|nr:TetR/AcrR family transcriptional regulator [Amycolatopsis sp. H20-H5]MEC3976280.1 TetR/AcrR family transcriptional regulator [Amycolatopsis sp. H20-H5]